MKAIIAFASNFFTNRASVVLSRTLRGASTPLAGRRRSCDFSARHTESSLVVYRILQLRVCNVAPSAGDGVVRPSRLSRRRNRTRPCPSVADGCFLTTAFRRVVVGSTRIVLIEEGPLIERLVSLFERNGTDATAAQPSGDRVCEAHILTPNLILLDLSRVAAKDTKGARAPREGMNAADAAIFKLAIAKPGAESDGVDALSVDGPRGDRLLPQERLLPHLLREEAVGSAEPAS